MKKMAARPRFSLAYLKGAPQKTLSAEVYCFKALEAVRAMRLKYRDRGAMQLCVDVPKSKSVCDFFCDQVCSFYKVRLGQYHKRRSPTAVCVR